VCSTFLAPRKSFDILALYKSDYYYYYYYSDLHPKFALSMADIQSLTAEIRRGKKRKKTERKKKPQGKKIVVCPFP